MSLNFEFESVLGDFKLEAKADLSGNGVTAVFGPSGCGKTSLLRLIAGLDKASRGQLSFNGSVWQSNSTWLAPWKRRVAYVFQQPSLFDHMDVSANLDFAVRRAVEDSVGLSKQQLIEMFALNDLLNRSVNTLSGGQQQRVAIARALCSRPQLLLMDEPLTALDDAAKKKILPYLESLCINSNIPILYVSHSVPEVARVADTLLLMDKGQIKSYGPIAKMLNRTDLGGRSSTEFDNFLVARLIKHEPQYGLSILESDLGTISVGTVNQEIGSTVRFTISARDISLTLERQQRTSILNIFAAKVEELQELDQSQVLLKLRANNTLVLAKITCKSVYNLALTPGLDVYCQAKTVSLL